MRQVLVEAGHRCAIPTCRFPTTEVAHIVPYSEVKGHAFDNLIALCPNCHRRYHAGGIDRQSMVQYKANLSVINGRYGDLERRVLQFFAEQPDADTIVLPGGFDILVWYLLKDGYLEAGQASAQPGIHGFPSSKPYHVTQAGRAFIQRWLAAKELR